MSTTYTDIDRMILERWDEVNQLVKAREELKGRIASVIDAAGERLRRWLDPEGYELETWSKDGEFHVWRRTWEAKKKGSAVMFVLEGFCPPDYRRSDEPYPCLSLSTKTLENYKLKEVADRRAFAAELRAQLGSAAADWDDDMCNEDWPLVQYRRDYDARRRTELVSSSDTLHGFAIKEFKRALAISDVVDRCVSRVLGK